MKRDLDLCKAIMFKASNDDADSIRFRQIQIDNYDEETIGYHVWLLGNGGYLDVTHNETTDGSFKYIQMNEITWQGQEFIDAAQNEKVWNKFKTKLIDAGGSIPFSIVTDVLAGIAKNEFGL